MPPSRSPESTSEPGQAQAGFPSFYGPTLLVLARRAIAKELGLPPTDSVDVQQSLRQPGATFVTLTIDGQLRGCIGSLEAWRSLKDDVEANARAAAFRDPRFPPLSAAEFDQVHVEVSVLSAPEPVEVVSEADAIAALRPGVHGAILQAGAHRGTFLPQVWDQLPEPTEFVAHLKRKAGLPAATPWGDDWRLSRYTVTAFEE